MNETSNHATPEPSPDQPSRDRGLLSFIGDVTTGEALVATALLFIFAPAMRYLMGRPDITSGGSLLAVGVMHASSTPAATASPGWCRPA